MVEAQEFSKRLKICRNDTKRFRLSTKAVSKRYKIYELRIRFMKKK